MIIKQSLCALLLGSVISLSLTSQGFCGKEGDENKDPTVTTIAVKALSLDDDPPTPLVRFEGLHHETLTDLLGFMKYSDLRSLRSTSKAWNAFIKDHFLGKIKHLQRDDNAFDKLSLPHLMRIHRLLDRDSPYVAKKLRSWLTSCPFERLEILIPTLEVMIPENFFGTSYITVNKRINALILGKDSYQKEWWIKDKGYELWKPHHLRLGNARPEIIGSALLFDSNFISKGIGLYSLVHLTEELSQWLLDVAQNNQLPIIRWNTYDAPKRQGYFNSISTFLLKTADQKEALNLLKGYYDKLPASLDNDTNQAYNRYIITSFLASHFNSLKPRPETTIAYKKVLDLFIDQTFLSKSFPSKLISPAMSILKDLIAAKTKEALAKLDSSFSTIEGILKSSDDIRAKIDSISKHLKNQHHFFCDLIQLPMSPQQLGVQINSEALRMQFEADTVNQLEK